MLKKWLGLAVGAMFALISFGSLAGAYSSYCFSITNTIAPTTVPVWALNAYLYVDNAYIRTTSVEIKIEDGLDLIDKVVVNGAAAKKAAGSMKFDLVGTIWAQFQSFQIRVTTGSSKRPMDGPVRIAITKVKGERIEWSTGVHSSFETGDSTTAEMSENCDTFDVSSVSLNYSVSPVPPLPGMMNNFGAAVTFSATAGKALVTGYEAAIYSTNWPACDIRNIQYRVRGKTYPMDEVQGVAWPVFPGVPLEVVVSGEIYETEPGVDCSQQFVIYGLGNIEFEKPDAKFPKRKYNRDGVQQSTGSECVSPQSEYCWGYGKG